jgi:hypothetical protein
MTHTPPKAPELIEKLRWKYRVNLLQLSKALDVPYHRLYFWVAGFVKPRPALWADFLQKVKKFERGKRKKKK